MVGWQRHFHSVIRQIGSRAEQKFNASLNFHGALTKPPHLLGQFPCSQGVLNFSSTHSLRPFHCYLQHLETNGEAEALAKASVFRKKGISSSRTLLVESSSDANINPVPSPLTLVPTLNSGNTENKAAICKKSRVQAVLKGIKQSPKKVNLVAALVRGMRVQDALLQMQVTVKRAAKTVFKVIHSVRANAIHNHGLDPDRLLIAEAFVGKGFFQKRVSYHARGKSGIIMKPECRLTIVVRETSPEEEAEIARLKVRKFRKLTKRETRLVPHQLIETAPKWHRKSSTSRPVQNTVV